jgi:hypothetical protein
MVRVSDSNLITFSPLIFILEDWPHFDCEGKRWNLDNQRWNYAPDCYNLCKGDIEDKLRQGLERGECHVHSGISAECYLNYGM